MEPPFPKLRSDLLISRQAGSGEAHVVIKDPLTRRFFRLREAEYAVVRRLDGATPLETVAHDVEADLDVAIDTNMVEQFVEQIRRTGLLETDQPASTRRSITHRVAGNPLYIRLKAFDPDRLFDRLLPAVGFFFTSRFLIFSAIIILIAACITIASWNEIARDVRGLYRFDALLLAWVTLLSVTTLHEFAHGLTCKHFGGHVHEIGFLLVYFQPAFYCNISDAWMFPEKSRRLWVTFAGGYFETVVWGFATLAWRMTDTDTWLNFLALIVMATSGIKLFFNLNPLIKLDGYYLLSDYLEIPNLRQKSFSYVKASITRLWRSTVNVAQVSGRERRILFAYGILATVYSYWLLGIVALHFGSFLVSRYQGMGFLLFTGLMMAVFQNPVGKAASRLKTALASPGSSVTSLKKRPRLLLVAAFVPILFLARAELRVSGEFTVLPGHNADVRAQVAGIIEHVYVDEGDHVRTGDPIARLGARDYRADLTQIDAEIGEKRARLKMLRAGPTRQEINLAQKELESARTTRSNLEKRYDEARKVHATRRSRGEATATAADTRVQYAGKDLERLRELFKRGLISRTQLEQREEEVRLREKELEAARAELAMVVADELSELGGELALATTAVEHAEGKLRVLLAGSRPEEIEAMEAEVARLEARQRYVDEQLGLVTITSPAPGVIATPKLKERIGEQVNKGDLVAEVYELVHVTPEILVSEKEIGEVKRGQKVILRARAHPEASLSGTVTAISPRAADSDGPERKVFRVTVTMDSPTTLLKPEMTGNAKILCGNRTIFHLVTRRITRYVRVEFWSWW
jgi:multidrug resistance efflux pump